MARIQTPITDLDALLVTLGSVQGAVVQSVEANTNGTFASDNGNGAAAPTYTDAEATFLADGLRPGDSVVISNTASGTNDSAADTSVILADVSETVLTFMSGTAITDQGTTDATFTKVSNDITVVTDDATQVHGLVAADAQVFAGLYTAAVPASGDTITAAGTDFSALAAGDSVIISDGHNRSIEATVSAAANGSLTVEQVQGVGPIAQGSNNDNSQAGLQRFVVQKVTFGILTSGRVNNVPVWAGTGYTGRYLVKRVVDSETVILHAFGLGAPLNAVGQTGAAINTTAETDVGEFMFDNNQGVFETPEVVIDAPNKTIQLRNAANSDLSEPGSGVVGQALYSFMKERWKEVEGLTRFDFPMLSITNEQFEFINGYVPADDTTRKMIRTAGWAERGADNIIRREYSGIITLGTLGDTDQPYFVQEGEPDSPIFETDFTGPVNEAVKNYASLTGTDIGFTAPSSAGADDGTITSTTTDLSAFAPGDVILVGNGTANDGDLSGNNLETFRVIDDAGNSSTQLTIGTVDGTDPAAHTAGSTTTLTMDQQTTFKIFVRERGKLYADADLADIGVSEMTYIVYRFPVSNAADLNIQTTSDNAITGGNIESLVVAGNTMTLNSSINTYTFANATSFVMNAANNTITSDLDPTPFAEFTPGHIISLSAQPGATVNTGTLTDNFGDYVIADIDGQTMTVSGRAIATTQNSTAGIFELFEPHGLYAGAPIHFDTPNNTPANAKGTYTVTTVPDTRSFTLTNDNSVADGTTNYATPVASAGLQYVRFQGGGTYISLEYIADTLDPTGIGTLETGSLKIWDQPYDSFGTQQENITVDIVRSTGSISTSDGDFSSFLVGQYVAVQGTAGGDHDDNYVVISKPSSTEMILGNIETGAVGIIGTADSTGDTPVTVSTFFGQHHVVQSSDNGKWYRQRTAVNPATIGQGVSTVDPVLDIATPTTDNTISWGATIDEDFEGAYTVETGVDSAYAIVLDGNTEANTPTVTKEIAYEWSQWALRQASVIDTRTVVALNGELNDTYGDRIGKIADLLVNFVGSTLVTTTSVFVEDINSLDINNIEFTDFEGESHVYPIEVQVNINFNDNLVNDAAAVFYAYYTSLSEVSADFEYGKNDAVQVNRIEAGETYKVGNNVSNLVANVTGGVYTFNYAFDSDTAAIPNGTSGRIGGTDQGITVVAIGLDTGQYVKASGTITSNGLTLSLVAPLERNYTDPVD